MVTLAMALAVTLAMGSAPAKVSGEVEQRLDLRGNWEGTWASSKWKVEVSFGGGVLTVSPRSRHAVKIPCVVTDLGSGGVVMQLKAPDGPIYRVAHEAEGDRVKLQLALQLAPGSFEGGPSVLTLRRVKPRK